MIRKGIKLKRELDRKKTLNEADMERMLEYSREVDRLTS